MYVERGEGGSGGVWGWWGGGEGGVRGSCLSGCVNNNFSSFARVTWNQYLSAMN